MPEDMKMKMARLRAMKKPKSKKGGAPSSSFTNWMFGEDEKLPPTKAPPSQRQDSPFERAVGLTTGGQNTFLRSEWDTMMPVINMINPTFGKVLGKLLLLDDFEKGRISTSELAKAAAKEGFSQLDSKYKITDKLKDVAKKHLAKVTGKGCKKDSKGRVLCKDPPQGKRGGNNDEPALDHLDLENIPASLTEPQTLMIGYFRYKVQNNRDITTNQIKNDMEMEQKNNPNGEFTDNQKERYLKLGRDRKWEAPLSVEQEAARNNRGYRARGKKRPKRGKGITASLRNFLDPLGLGDKLAKLDEKGISNLISIVKTIDPKVAKVMEVLQKGRQFLKGDDLPEGLTIEEVQETIERSLEEYFDLFDDETGFPDSLAEPNAARRGDKESKGQAGFGKKGGCDCLNGRGQNGLAGNPSTNPRPKEYVIPVKDVNSYTSKGDNRGAMSGWKAIGQSPNASSFAQVSF